MMVRVKLFAGARQRVGSEEIQVHVTEPATIAALRAAIGQQYPDAIPLLRSAMFAIDTEYAADATVIPSNSEVACIPPVSGG
jgi:molybdopterin converting factor small subunit